MNTIQCISKLIGNTPLIKINYIYLGQCKCMYAKLEWFNLSGSIKDRPALNIIKQAINSGVLKPNQTICETTSGNMGISLCAIASALGYPVVICMPHFMSEERKQLLKLYGAKLVLTEDFKQAFETANKYRLAGAFMPSQFANPDNTASHYSTTAVEIHNKLSQVPCFVSGVGTGGTLMGIGGYLRKQCNTKIIAIEPDEAPILSTGISTGKHQIQGLSDGLIPDLYDKNLINQIIRITSNDAIAMAQKLCRELGLGCGISSGANFLGCVLSGIDSATTVFADDNKKYLSTNLTNSIPSQLVDNITLIDYEVL